MESSINKNLPIEQVPNEEDKRELKFIQNIWVWSIIALVLLFLFGFFAFVWKRNLNCSTSIDASAWGSFGEYIGGILGTIVAFVSVFFLVRTLKNQIKSNEEISKNNKEITKNNEYNTEIYKLQQFHDTFETLVTLYYNSIESFQKGNNKKGKQVLHEEVEELQQKFTETETNYEKLTKKTENAFNLFYTKYREYASVYFRLLYRIFQLIDTSDIVKKRKSEYAKIIRCLLSEDEMFLLRYSAMTTNGKKMQNYINRYNLLKHLPLMNLLEFSVWRNKISPTEKNYLDSLFVDLRKRASELLKDKEVYITDYGKYTIKMELEDNNTFKIEMIKQKQSRNNINNSLSSVLDNFSENDLFALMEAFIKEIFIFSNFEIYTKFSDIDINPKDPDTVEDLIRITIRNKNNYPLILSQSQLNAPHK